MNKEKFIVRIKDDKLKFKVNKSRGWNEYKRTLTNRDFNQLAIIFFELSRQGYPIEKAFRKFKELENNPDLFYL